MIWKIAGCTMALSLTVACATEQEKTVCQKMCSDLVSTCEYDAFPDTTSCVQGCEYNAEAGADVGGQQLCVEAAECDTFAILECELEFGVDPSKLEDTDA